MCLISKKVPIRLLRQYFFLYKKNGKNITSNIIICVLAKNSTNKDLTTFFLPNGRISYNFL